VFFRKEKRMRPYFLPLAEILTGAAGMMSAAGSAAQTEPPNIVFILADDLGYGDVGFTGSKTIRTPHLDRLAAEGVVLTDFHANGPTCTPTRAALLTGRYQQRSGLVTALQARSPDYERVGLAPHEVTIPELLKDAGYRSALLGKWHLGSNPGAHPIRQGFDHFTGNLGGHVDYISHWGRRGFDWHSGFDPLMEEGYVTHLLTDHTLDFIRENRDTPFFIFFSHACPHTPHQVPGDDPVYREDGATGRGIDSAKYGPMIEEMDAGVGLIMEEVERFGLDRKTLVIFTSDNGPHPRAGSSGPYRGHKSLLYEGGHRVPFAARWPGRIPAGSVHGDLAMTADLLPTLLELAGLELPDEPKMDGISMAPLLLRGDPLPNRVLFWDNVNNRAVRDGDWKMVSVLDRSTRSWTTELYRLDADPGESRDLSREHPEVLQRMQQHYDAWRREVNQGAVEQPFYQQ
jgi:arylsulfatase A